jgi:hypothetical protein
MERRTKSQEAYAQIVEQFEIRSPMLVEATLFHLVDTHAPAFDRRYAVFNTRGKHEKWIDHSFTCKFGLDAVPRSPKHLIKTHVSIKQNCGIEQAGAGCPQAWL